MIVVDASIVANVVADDGPDGRLARDRIGNSGDIAAPDLVDVETVSVLRKRRLAGDLTERRFSVALGDLEALAIIRYPALPLMRRAFELRANVTAYDAAYIALAEGLGCPLMTADTRLAHASGPACEISLLRP